ncbi:hypothetical protein [Erythrobacter sp. HL-111]|uniref:hypothetical protein n=1 Tax=Erythrobacter sp. HL-111 TaxID=1798193 RepID=UPI0006DAA4EC|nr:hypothetical protein [Erythrobacter sp. HL-111]KPP83635.1 MAG: hypothetical protein HLUCCO15_14045 [Erythrobacteraceae bacterium HL-111]SDS84061.1 hypothetical protein SAMN04515621_2340 [Erythrobacter sp. HL-111]
MRRRAAFALSLAAGALVLAGCASNRPRGPSDEVIGRVLTGTPGEAQPSRIVAVESAYARAARERGQFTAMGEFAGPTALLHGRDGPVSFAALSDALEDPEEPVQWAPRTIVMSCDGALAVSAGRFVEPGGLVGTYVTTWARQPDGRYKWAYDVAGRDDPQPPPRPEAEEGDIVVTAMDSILGLIASCPPAGLEVPAPPPVPIGEGAGDARLSPDGTLRWRWEHGAEGAKQVAVDYFYEGEWVTAIEESLASGPLE